VTPIASLVDAVPVMEVHPSVPAKTVAEFIAYAKANPGKIMYASSGHGSLSHVSAELFKTMSGVSMLHVPYRGSAPALTDLVAGHVDVFFDLIASSIGYIKAGKLRALAVAMATRSAALPGIPPLDETLPGFAVSGWEGLVAPKGTPASVVERLNKEVNAALADPALIARFAALGATVLPSSPADFGKNIAADTEKWAKVSKLLDIKAD
jgi:tripartite-type tricarboxylate transporter receptor subunit TctC